MCFEIEDVEYLEKGKEVYFMFNEEEDEIKKINEEIIEG